MVVLYHDQKKEIKYQPQMSGRDLVRRLFPEQRDDVLCMACDAELQSLNNKIAKDTGKVILYDIHHPLGAHCLAISTVALMLMAAEGLFPETRISVEHSFSKGFYCEAIRPDMLPANYLDLLQRKMHTFVQSGYEFEERVVSIEQIRDFDYKRFMVLKYSPRNTFRIYDLCGFPHWFISPLVPSAAYIKLFRMTPYDRGFVLEFPTQSSPAGSRNSPLRRTCSGS
ncbi:MAG: hypothetical protein U5N26_00440 [Candidatus Marinimicrobia bacterium]|nr:hypothetical protein [Candidatus Neomarinimicrobiota bacterium]